MIKKILAVVLVSAVTMTMASCGSSLTDVYNYNLADYIKVGDYTGLDVKYNEVKVTQADIDEALDNALQSAAAPEKITTGTVAKGDTINLDYKGTIDG